MLVTFSVCIEKLFGSLSSVELGVKGVRVGRTKTKAVRSETTNVAWDVKREIG